MAKRLTKKLFLEFIQEEFNRLGFDKYTVTQVYRTYYTAGQYESGACSLIIHFGLKEKTGNLYFDTSHFLCFYTLSQYQYLINQGYEMYLKLDRERYSLTDATIEIRKKQTQ